MGHHRGYARPDKTAGRERCAVRSRAASCCMGGGVPCCLDPWRRNARRVPDNPSKFGSDENHRFMREIRRAYGVWLLGDAFAEPFPQTLDWVRSVGDHPEHHVHRASGVGRVVVGAAAKLGWTPIPVRGVAPEQTGQGWVVGETDDDVEVPDATLAASIVLGAALGEGDEANAATPASEPGIASEELVELSVSGAAEAREIGLVERFIGACRIACQLEVPPRYGEHLVLWHVSSITYPRGVRCPRRTRFLPGQPSHPSGSR